MSLSEATVLATLDRLAERGLVSQRHQAGARVAKWEHQIRLRHSLTPPMQAVLAIPHAARPANRRRDPRPLRAHARLRQPAEVEEILESLGDKYPPMVDPAAQGPGTKEARYTHLMSGEAAAPARLRHRRRSRRPCGSRSASSKKKSAACASSSNGSPTSSKPSANSSSKRQRAAGPGRPPPSRLSPTRPPPPDTHVRPSPVRPHRHRHRPLAVRWYGLMYLVAFILFVVSAASTPAAAPTRLDAQQIDDLLFYGVLGVIPGGRLGYVLFYKPAYYLAHPAEILAVWQGGMAFHGGFLGVLVAMWLFGRRTQRPWLPSPTSSPRWCPRPRRRADGQLHQRRTRRPRHRRALGDGLPAGRTASPPPSQLYQFALEGLSLFFILWWFSAKPGPAAWCRRCS